MGDIVFARRAVRSDAIRGRVDKLSYPSTGPWRIVANFPGASYDIEHCSTKKREKRHASDLSPYPVELLPLHPLDGADNQYSQINKKILENPYIQAGIKGFTPPTPFRVPSNFFSANTGFHWPTLAKLNEDLFPFDWDLDPDLSDHPDDDEAIPSPVFYTGPPPSTPTYSAPDISPANVLAQHIISSRDRLFFISHAISSGDVWWLLKQLCLSILPVLLMGATWWIFILPIHLILGTTLSTSGSGFSITVATTSLAQRLRLILITFDRLIPLKPTLPAIVFFLIGNTST